MLNWHGGQASRQIMRKQIIVLAISLVWLALATGLIAQVGGRGRGGVAGGAETDTPSVPAPPGWKPCPRCQNNADRRKDNITYKVQGHSFDPHDFSGVWGFNGTGQLGAPPPLTAWGKEQHEKTIGEKNQYGEY